MKKLMLCWMVVTLSVAQVEANFTFLEKIKSKSVAVLETTKKAAVCMLSYIRESNSVSIKKALDAKEAMKNISASLQIGVDGQDALLQNVNALGFDKKNAISALTMIQKQYAAMQSVANRFNSALTPWNKSEEMELTANEIAPYLQACKVYKLYFESHKDCLKGWELAHRYEQNIAKIDIADADSTQLAISAWYKNGDDLVKSVDQLTCDIAFIKSCLSRKAFRQAYPELCEQLYEYLIILEFVNDNAQKSREYKSQLFYKTNRPTPPSKKEEISEKAPCCHDHVSDSLLQTMNPFNNYESDQE